MPKMIDYDMLSVDLADMLDKYGYDPDGIIGDSDIRPFIESFMVGVRQHALDHPWEG